MTLLSHHAHIFIGNPRTSKERIFEYLRDEGVDTESQNIYVQETGVFTIGQARELKRFVSQKSTNGQDLFVLILTENFSFQAQHALLKTLEEPKKGVCILFVTPRVHTLLSTLRSRVQLHYLTVSKSISPIDVSVFKNTHVGERIAMVNSYLQKVKNEESENVRHEVHYFLNAYEEKLYEEKKIEKNIKEFEVLFFVKEYITDQGSSVKQLLEHLALMKG